jgi:hypothetical protein
MADIVAAKSSFIGDVGGRAMDIRKGDLFEADHPAVAKWPALFGPVTLRFPVERKSKVEQATAGPGEKRAR